MQPFFIICLSKTQVNTNFLMQKKHTYNSIGNITTIGSIYVAEGQSIKEDFVYAPDNQLMNAYANHGTDENLRCCWRKRHLPHSSFQ